MSETTIDQNRVDPSASPDRLAAVRRTGLVSSSPVRRFDQLTDLASSLTGAPMALISMVGSDRQFFTSQTGLTGDVAVRRSTPISQSVCRTVVDTGGPLEIGDLAGDHRFADHEARSELGIEAYCGVPIRDGEGHVLGSFCVLDSDRREWAPGTVETLERLAGVVEDSIVTHSEFISLVVDLQSRLIPSQMVEPAGGSFQARYRPVAASAQIGGDFYDSFTRRDGSTAVVVGDVVGHGVESTHAAAQLRAAARAVFTGAERSPAQIINRISEACADLPDCMCAAVIVASLSADGRRVTWARAGAMPPVLTGPNARVLGSGGSPPLGVGRCEPDEVSEIDLDEGEGLMFFTDGLVERRGEGIDDGLARVVDAVREDFVLDALVESVCPAAIQEDDVAVVRWSRQR